ncbi:MAG: hypothetical protein KDI55_29320, partial [Anaerolineae bacterium]|nr:hypothetical protein [Anaerolineae bacterium]
MKVAYPDNKNPRLLRLCFLGLVVLFSFVFPHLAGAEDDLLIRHAILMSPEREKPTRPLDVL